MVFVVAAAFLIFDLDDKLYPKQKQYAATIDYTDDAKTIIPEPDVPTVLPSQQTIVAKKPEFSTRIQEPKSRLNELENKQFSLSLSGDAYLGGSGVVKKASLTLKLVPVKGTNLSEFQVLDSRLLLDSSGVSISGTGMRIDGNDMTIGFVSDSVGKFEIHAVLDESILHDTNNKQSVMMKNQDFYLIKKETPYRLNLIGTMSS